MNILQLLYKLWYNVKATKDHDFYYFDKFMFQKKNNNISCSRYKGIEK